MIFAGVLLPVLLLIVGIVVEGGYVVTKYRQMQVAADMAALVGAQALPCAVGESDCIVHAEQRACQYAADNGFSSCSPGATSGSSANVPPLSCSPYDTIDYGNAATNSSCKSSSASISDYGYLEVRLNYNISAPIFSTLFTLTAHAVARHGQVSPRRFAIEVLDPTMSRALNMSGSQGGGLITVGPVVSDSTASDSIYTGGQAVQVTCSGQWYTAANEVVPPGGPASGVTSNTGGSASFAPPGCSGGSSDWPPRFLSNFPPVSDPYSSSTTPDGNMPDCTPCNSLAEVYTWSTSRSAGTWQTADQQYKFSGGVNAELFPGIYPNGLSISGGNVYFNPGVYTFQGDMSVTGGNICIYGAPVCDHLLSQVNSQASCSDVSFTSGATNYVDSGAWYYYCSPWGFWDPTSNLGGSRPVTTTAPTFSDGTPLNGVTLYFQSGNISLNGNGTEYLAFPNPCPGTGTGGAQSVPWPAGDTSASYTYPATSLAAQDGLTSSSVGQVYPSGDLGYAAECSQAQPPNARLVWTGEMSGQHLHFLIFTRNPATSITLNGTGLQNWFGIIYSPGSAGCGNACLVKINGSGGSGTGPPLLTGQIIADNATFSGTAGFEVYYSPCQPDGDICSAGYGTSLVE